MSDTVVLGENEHLNVVTALPEAVVTSALPCERTSLTILNAYHRFVMYSGTSEMPGGDSSVMRQHAGY